MLKTNPGLTRILSQAGMAGVMLAACIFVGTALGYGLDRWLGTRPWFTLILMVAGIVAGFYNIIRIVISLGEAQKPQ